MGLVRLAYVAQNPHVNGCGLSLHYGRSEPVVLEEVVRRPMGRLVRRDVFGRGELLEPGGGVHYIAGDDALALDGTGAEVHDRLARRNAGAGRKARGSRVRLDASDCVDDRGRN